MPPELNKNYLATDIEIKGTIKFAAALTATVAVSALLEAARAIGIVHR